MRTPSKGRVFATSCILAIFCAPAHTAKAPAESFQLMETTISQVHAAYASKKLTAHQLVQQYLDRIAAYDKQGPNINCVITLNPKAMEEADRLDAAYKKSGLTGPLHGIPILVKDQVDAAGMPTTLGSLVFKNYRPPRDSFVVAKLRKAGAIILGKTTLGEFGGGDAYGSLFGVTRNPYDLERTVGGSSGGSGACLTSNFSTVAVGEEGFASIRRPSTWNDVVGMRPTAGLASRSGMYDGYPSPVGSLGPMARTVEDLARLLDVMVGYDPEDPVTALGVGHVPDTYTKSLDRNGLKGARIGIIRESFGNKSDPNSEDFKKVDAAFDKAVQELKAAGATLVDPIVIPDLNKLIAKRAASAKESAASLKVWLARNPDSPYKTRADVQHSPDISKIIPPSKAQQWMKEPVDDPKKYGEYLAARDQLAINVWKVMADNKLDAIVHKSVEHQPTLIKDGINPPYTNSKGVPHLNTFLIYAASMTVPAGFTSDNLPVGITFFGRPYSEPVLLKLAYAYEQATRHRVPPGTVPALSSVAASLRR
jgi:Asp-tRNA(Asn)/Glu-tRNA(Gln) amidotransferase A subunit family amidase